MEIATGKKSNSVVCGRALVGLPIIAEITGDQRYLKVSEEMEKFLRANVEGRFWYTGMHPDLPPDDFEQDSIYAVVEYWLNKHDRTGRAGLPGPGRGQCLLRPAVLVPEATELGQEPHAVCPQRAAAFQPVFGLLLRQPQDRVPGPAGPKDRATRCSRRCSDA